MPAKSEIHTRGNKDRPMYNISKWNLTLNKDTYFLESCKHTGKAFSYYYFKMGKNFLNNIGNKQAMKLTDLAT